MVMQEIPLSVVDIVHFKQFMSIVQPLFQVLSRNIIKKEIVKLYEERTWLQDYLRTCINHNCFTLFVLAF
ncbi:hypothetical protein LINGRAPRIM_LOCUS279 [Linum grandiflorum]